MKKNEATIFVFIASIVLGILISMNIKFSSLNSTVFLTIEQYNAEYNKRMLLSRNIRDLQKETQELEEKLRKYELNSYSQDGIKAQIEEEVNINNVYLGNVPLVGKGVHMVLNDAKSFGLVENYMGSNNIHDSDIWYILNDLRIAGAEAISVNGNRVLPKSYTTCGGVYIEMDEAKMVAPFYIDAIGNSAALMDYILSEESHIKMLEVRDMQISIAESDNIEVPPYVGGYSFKYAKLKK